MMLRACQQRHNDLLFPALEAGEQRVVVTSPTGSGKSKMICDLLEWAGTASVFTHRRILKDQISKQLNEAGISHGIRAAGHKTQTLKDVQVCMLQTEAQKVYRSQQRELHGGRIVVFDECHLQRGGVAKKIADASVERGSGVVGYTATPLNIGDMYSRLEVVGTVSECIAEGSLVPCMMFAPDEPQLSHIKQYKVGEDLTDGENVKAIMRHGIFGRVLSNYRATNPDGHPSILFAPGVPESVWFAQKFTEEGIRAASIDGKNIWLDGVVYDSTPEKRAEVAEGSRDGSIKVLCNRFVLREGVDYPWLAHGMLTCVFGGLTSYLQAVGRLLRAYPGKERAIVQDHGGNYHRHGPPDVDREWNLEFTDPIVVGLRELGLREQREAEPITCPQCFAVRYTGQQCSVCGFRSPAKTRNVVQVDGSLRLVEGDIYRPRKVKIKPDTEQKWKRYYWGAYKGNKGMTFNQAIGYFRYKERYWPDISKLSNVPVESIDFFRRVRDVPRERLK